jgi:hypothetical protein
VVALCRGNPPVVAQRERIKKNYPFPIPEKLFEKCMDISEIGSYNGLLDTKYKSSNVPPFYPILLYPNTLGILKSSSHTRGGG